MKKCLMMLINQVYLEELETFYGKDSKIDITSINVLSLKNKTMIHYKLFYTNKEYFSETMDDGAIFLINKSWEMMGYPETELILTCTFENS